jgi:hypothetical protein
VPWRAGDDVAAVKVLNDALIREAGPVVDIERIVFRRQRPER